MSQKVTGYLATDNVFFKTEVEARLHEAELEIAELCSTYSPQPINAVRFLATIEAMAAPIMRYLNACKEIEDKQVRKVDENSSKPDRDTSNNRSGTDDAKALV